MSNTIYTKITTRLWFNPQFGKGIGPRRKNNIIYNGSVSFEEHGIKGWVDLAGLDHMQDSFHHLVMRALQTVFMILLEISDTQKIGMMTLLQAN